MAWSVWCSLAISVARVRISAIPLRGQRCVLKVAERRPPTSSGCPDGSLVWGSSPLLLMRGQPRHQGDRILLPRSEPSSPWMVLLRRDHLQPEEVRPLAKTSSTVSWNGDWHHPGESLSDGLLDRQSLTTDSRVSLTPLTSSKDMETTARLHGITRSL